MTNQVSIVCNIRCELGEGPLWCERENAVYWVDILAPALHKISLVDFSVSTWQMPELIGWIAERENEPGFIAGLKNGIHILKLDPFELIPMVDAEPELPDNRMNDAKVDHLGRIWAGSMAMDARGSQGSLYCLSHDFSVSKQDSDYGVANGPAFDPNLQRLYHTDTARGIIYQFEFSASGELGSKAVFKEFPKDWGLPDGMTVDAEGGLWVAHWGGACVSRFLADGSLDRKIKLPASQITSCAFVGKDLDRLFVTSAAEGKGQETNAGMLFEIQPGVQGVSQGRFAG